MKCKHCNKKITGEPAYYKKDPVHPVCYSYFKYKKLHSKPKTKPIWLNPLNYPKPKK